MRTVVLWISTVAAAIGGVALFVELSRTPNPTASLESPLDAIRSEVPQSSGSARGMDIGETRAVTFEVSANTWSRLSARERIDQQRDWLLYAAASSFDLDAEELNTVLFDVPALRSEYLSRVTELQYGPIRSVVLPDGRAVALLPTGASEESSRAMIAEVADEHRKNSGESPSVEVFWYDCRASDLSGTLRRGSPVAADNLFSPAYGYSEVRVTSREDLEAFFRACNQVTYARRDDRAIVLGGRSVPHYEGLAISDVAAVWQAQSDLEDRRRALESEYERRQRELYDHWNAVARNQSLGGHFSTNDFNLPQLPQFQADPELQRLLKQLRHANPSLGAFDGLGVGTQETKFKIDRCTPQQHYDAAMKELEREYALKFMRSGISDGTGFSLDPSYDFEGLLEWYDGAGSAEFASLVDGSLLEFETCLRTAAANQKVGTRTHDDELGPFYSVLSKVSVEGSIAAKFVVHVVDSYRYQAARYDGRLQGTRVGMVLFYTDLLAKLWFGIGFDPPFDQFPDLTCGSSGGLPAFYKQETIQYPSCRLWFGLDQSAIQRAGSGGEDLLLGPYSTRVFSASSKAYEPGKEVPASYSLGQCIEWLNEHYRDIALYEPQYQILNEYIKWSAIVSWMFATDIESEFDFLSGVKVDRDCWFPEWVREHAAELRFKSWERIDFHDKESRAGLTEALPILSSEFFANFGSDEPVWTISGGVSGASPRLIAQRASLTPVIAKRFRSSLRGVDVSAIEASRPGRLVLRNKTTVDVSGSRTIASWSAHVSDDAVLRGRQGLLTPSEVTRRITIAPDAARGVRVQCSVGSHDVGSLRLRTSGSETRIRFAAGDVENGLSLMRRVSQAEQTSSPAIQSVHSVSEVVAGDGVWHVRFRGSDSWMTFTKAAVDPAEWKSWFGVASDGGVGCQSLQFRWQPSSFVPRAGTTSRHPVVRALERGDRVAAARRMTEDVAGARAAIRQDLAERLSVADDMLAAGRGGDAAAELRSALAVHGDEPRLLERMETARIVSRHADLDRAGGQNWILLERNGDVYEMVVKSPTGVERTRVASYDQCVERLTNKVSEVSGARGPEVRCAGFDRREFDGLLESWRRMDSHLTRRGSLSNACPDIAHAGPRFLSKELKTSVQVVDGGEVYRFSTPTIGRPGFPPQEIVLDVWVKGTRGAAERASVLSRLSEALRRFFRRLLGQRHARVDPAQLYEELEQELRRMQASGAIKGLDDFEVRLRAQDFDVLIGTLNEASHAAPDVSAYRRTA